MFRTIKNVYERIRNIYLKLWQDYTTKHYSQKDFKQLNESKKMELVEALPVNIQFKLNYLTIDSEYLEDKIIELGPISPFQYPIDKGLK